MAAGLSFPFYFLLPLFHLFGCLIDQFLGLVKHFACLLLGLSFQLLRLLAGAFLDLAGFRYDLFFHLTGFRGHMLFHILTVSDRSAFRRSLSAFNFSFIRIIF